MSSCYLHWELGVRSSLSGKTTDAFRLQEMASVGDFGRSLAHKYGPQKVMGQPPEDNLHHTSIDADKGGHAIPVENFLNTQCWSLILSFPRRMTNRSNQISAPSPSAPRLKNSTSSSTPAAPISGFPARNVPQLLVTSTPNITPTTPQATKRMAPNSPSDTALEASKATSHRISYR